MTKYSDYYPHILGIVSFIVCFFLFSGSLKDGMDFGVFLLFLILLILPWFILTIYYSVKHNGKFYYLHAQNRGSGPRIDGFLFLFMAYFLYYILILIAYVLFFAITIDVLNPQIQLFVLLLFNPIFAFLLMMYGVNRFFSKPKEEKL